jgi:hypothetical protein
MFQKMASSVLLYALQPEFLDSGLRCAAPE